MKLLFAIVATLSVAPTVVEGKRKRNPIRRQECRVLKTKILQLGSTHYDTLVIPQSGDEGENCKAAKIDLYRKLITRIQENARDPRGRDLYTVYEGLEEALDVNSNKWEKEWRKKWKKTSQLIVFGPPGRKQGNRTRKANFNWFGNARKNYLKNHAKDCRDLIIQLNQLGCLSGNPYLNIYTMTHKVTNTKADNDCGILKDGTRVEEGTRVVIVEHAENEENVVVVADMNRNRFRLNINQLAPIKIELRKQLAGRILELTKDDLVSENGRSTPETRAEGQVKATYQATIHERSTMSDHLKEKALKIIIGAKFQKAKLIHESKPRNLLRRQNAL